MRYEADECWECRIEVRREEQNDRYGVRGQLMRGAQRMELMAPLLMANAGFVFLRDRVARFETHGAFEWARLLREHGSIHVPVSEGDEFLRELLRQPHLRPLDLNREAARLGVLRRCTDPTHGHSAVAS